MATTSLPHDDRDALGLYDYKKHCFASLSNMKITSIPPDFVTLGYYGFLFARTRRLLHPRLNTTDHMVS